MKNGLRTLAGLSGLLIGVLCGAAFGQTNTNAYVPTTGQWVPVGSPTAAVASAQVTPGPTAPVPVAVNPAVNTANGVKEVNTASFANTANGTNTNVNTVGYLASATTNGVLPTSYTSSSATQNRVNSQFGLPTTQLASRVGYEQIPAPAPLDAAYSNTYPQVANGTGAAISQTGYAAPMANQSVYPGGSQYVEYSDAAPGYATGISTAYNNNYATATGYSGYGYAGNGYAGNCAPSVCGDVGCTTGYTTGCDTGCATGYATGGGYANYGAYSGVGTTGYDPGYLDMINPLRGLPCVFSGSVGLESFRSSFDGPRSANMGFRESVNLGGPLFPGLGLGYQVGVAGWQGNFDGNSSPFEGDEGERSQIFFTTGLFRRNVYQGFQYGFAWDYMKDDYFNDVEMSSVRAEIGFRVGPRFDFGYYGLYNTGDDEYALDAGNSGYYELTSLHTAYLRWTFENNATARINGGASQEGDGFISGSIVVPVAQRLALDTQCYGLFPDEKTNGWGVRNDAWGMGMQLVWYPGRSSCEALQNPYTPFFNVAGNMTHFYQLKRD